MFRHRNVALGVIAVAVVLIVQGAPIGSVLIAAFAAYVMFSIGFTVLGSMARPIPEPPPPGELRRVRLTYRCDICGTEVRMTAAATDDPEPPRHCLDEMVLITPTDDL